MKVLLVLILIVGAFCLGAWTDHVFYMPLGTTSSTADIGPSAPPAAPPATTSGAAPTQAQNAAPNGAPNAAPNAASAGPVSNAPDFRSCLAEARSRHLEAGYAERMCREIVND